MSGRTPILVLPTKSDFFFMDGTTLRYLSEKSDTEYVKDLPTNDVPSRLDVARRVYCSRVCDICGVIACKTTTHQPWRCRCGHMRTLHMPWLTSSQATYQGHPNFVRPSQDHPHPCRAEGCRCEALTFLTLEDIETQLTEVEIRWR